ncbi:MAG: hypothetical protein ACI8P3_001186 [Saprospiraceae bacterium]|jgi:hypothetical protein
MIQLSCSGILLLSNYILLYGRIILNKFPLVGLLVNNIWYMGLGLWIRKND